MKKRDTATSSPVAARIALTQKGVSFGMGRQWVTSAKSKPGAHAKNTIIIAIA
jgi:hypothetical protein